jgi:hypothetical protein
MKPDADNITVEILSAKDGNSRSTGSAVQIYYYQRDVTGVIRNRSDVAVNILVFTLAGSIVYNNGYVQSAKTVSVLTNVIIEAGWSYGWAQTYETLGHRIDGGETRSEAVETLSLDPLDSRCQ